MSAKYEFIVSEPFVAVGRYLVVASTRAEALQKVIDGDDDVSPLGDADLFPSRLMTVRDVRRGVRIEGCGHPNHGQDDHDRADRIEADQ